MAIIWEWSTPIFLNLNVVVVGKADVAKVRASNVWPASVTDANRSEKFPLDPTWALCMIWWR